MWCKKEFNDPKWSNVEGAQGFTDGGFLKTFHLKIEEFYEIKLKN